MEQTEYEAFNKKRTRLLPTEVKGWTSGGDAKKPAKKAAAKKVAAKKAAPKAEESEEGGLEAIKAQIITIAKTSEDDGGATFIERCYAEIDGLDANDEAMALVDDVESEDSIWQTVGATEVE
jgi:hypothetical protein